MLGASRLTVAAGLVLALGLIAGLGVYLMHTHGDARRALQDGLVRRAGLSGRLISSALLTSSTQRRAEADFGGSARAVSRSVDEYMSRGQLSRVLILDARGRVVAASAPSLRRDRRLLARNPHLRIALRGRRAISDVFLWSGRRPTFEVAFPIRAGGQRRVVGVAGPVHLIRNFASSFLAGASAVRG